MIRTLRFFADLLSRGVHVGPRVCDRCHHHTTRVDHLQADLYVASMHAGKPLLPCWCGGELVADQHRPRRWPVAREVLALAWQTYRDRSDDGFSPQLLIKRGTPGRDPGAPLADTATERGNRP
jgi:hypothetical protein